MMAASQVDGNLCLISGMPHRRILKRWPDIAPTTSFVSDIGAEDRSTPNMFRYGSVIEAQFPLARQFDRIL
jgi:hypothetical protein